MTALRSFPFNRCGRQGTGWEDWEEWQTLPKWCQPSYLLVQTWNCERLLSGMRWSLIVFTWAGRGRSWVLNTWGWSCKDALDGLQTFVRAVLKCTKEHLLVLLVHQAVIALMSVLRGVHDTGPHWPCRSLLPLSHEWFCCIGSVYILFRPLPLWDYNS